jgi:predicted TIM-barrel fold metal-dependent hydrolase
MAAWDDGRPVTAPHLRVNYPPDPNPRPPKFTPPPGTCDSHFHVYGPPHRFAYVAQRRYTPPAAPIEHYMAMAGVVGIERGVLVQPNVHGFENDVVIDAIARADGRLRGVINANPELSTVEAKLLHAGGVRGIRFNFTHDHGAGFNEERFLATVSTIASLAWSVDLHIDVDTLARDVEAIRRMPLPVVIDHYARADAAKGPDDPGVRVMLDLMGEGNTWVKISGADRSMGRGAAFADIKALVQALIARAPDRILWGSDWPHSGVFEPGKMPNDGALLDMMVDYAPDEALRRKILVDNPAALFGLG